MPTTIVGAPKTSQDIVERLSGTHGALDLAYFDNTLDSNATHTIDTTNGGKLFTTDANAEADVVGQRLLGINAHVGKSDYLAASIRLKMARNADLEMGWTFGFSTGAVGDLLVDTTTAVCTNFDGAVFTIAHDSLAVGTTISNATTQSSTTDEATIGETSWHHYKVEIRDVVNRGDVLGDGVNAYYCTVNFYVDGVLVRTQDNYAIASWGPFPVVIAQKATSANDQILYWRDFLLEYRPGDGSDV